MEDNQGTPKDNLNKWADFVNPALLKDNMIAISLFIANFEALKDYIVEQPKSFFETGFNENGSIIDSAYSTDILSKNRNVVTASLLWWVEMEAITQSDIDTYHIFRQHRNKLTHEMLKYLFDGLEDDFPQQFANIVAMKIKLDRWWTFNIEIPTNPDLDDLPEINPEEVSTSSEILHQLISDILSEDQERANYYIKAFMEQKDSMSGSNSSDEPN